MHKRFLGTLIAVLALGSFLSEAPPVAAQTTPAGVPRMKDGKPNLTGLWQTFSTADWDIQAHGAQPGPFYQLGAIGAIPPGQSIVAGDEIPYLPAALEQKKKNLA